MTLELYMLVELSMDIDLPDELPGVSTRVVEIQSSDEGQRTIIKSEWGYLGTASIPMEEGEDEDGVEIIRFNSVDDSPRQFVAEEPDDPEYLEGDVLLDGRITGSFVLRKLSGLSSDDL